MLNSKDIYENCGSAQDVDQVCKTGMAVLQLPKVKSSHLGCAAALSSILGSLLPRRQPPSSSKVQVISSPSFLSASHSFPQDLKIPFSLDSRNLSALSVYHSFTLIHLSPPERVSSPFLTHCHGAPPLTSLYWEQPPFLFCFLNNTHLHSPVRKNGNINFNSVFFFFSNYQSHSGRNILQVKMLGTKWSRESNFRTHRAEGRTTPASCHLTFIHTSLPTAPLISEININP